MSGTLGLFFFVDFVSLLIEQAAVLWLGQRLFSEVRALWPAALLLQLFFLPLSWLTVKRLTAPLFAMGAALSKKTESAPPGARPLEPRSRSHSYERIAYRRAASLPMDMLWLRVVLLTALSALLGFYGVQVHALPKRGAAFLLWTAAFLAPLLDSWRALFFERAVRRFISRLWATRLSLRIPAILPAELQHGYLIDTFESRMLLVSLGLLGGALVFGALIMALSFPALRLLLSNAAVGTQPLSALLFFAPPFGICLLALGIALYRRHTRPIERFFLAARTGLDPLAADLGRPLPSLDGPALRLAERLPNRLILGKLGAVFAFLLLESLTVTSIFDDAPAAAVLLYGEIFISLSAFAAVEWLWQTALLWPLLPQAPLSQRTRRVLSTAALLLAATMVPLLLYSGLLGAFLGLSPAAAQAPRAVSLLLCFAGAALLILVATLLGLRWRLGRLLQPLAALREKAAALANGASSVPKGELLPAPFPDSGPRALSEVSKLEQSLFAMREVLQERLLGTAQAQARLEAEVAERTAELSRRNQELEQALTLLREAQNALLHAEKMASIGRLVAGIAHEINNPINAVVNTANPLREALHDLSERLSEGFPLGSETASLLPELQGMLRVLYRGSHRAQEIVKALHNYAQGSSDLPIAVEIHRVLDEALELLQHPDKARIEVVRTYRAPAELVVLSLGGQLQQVFVNLISNAVHALSSGTESRPGHAPRIEIATDVDLDRHEVRIAVRDNGPGISPTVLPRIFDPFFTTKDATEGSGLGLSIVHGILARHRGQIHVETEMGQGTVFTVLLPLPDHLPDKVKPAGIAS